MTRAHAALVIAIGIMLVQGSFFISIFLAMMTIRSSLVLFGKILYLYFQIISL